ncbi:MAG: hypothetical protein V1743_01350 [Nanoarchaeota archaeon]
MVDKRGESVLNRKLFKEVFLKRIHYLMTKRLVTEKEAYNLIKDFFKEYLHLDYEFTEQELQDELKKVYLPNDVRKKLNSLLNDIFRVEYTEKQLEDEKLREHLREFRKIIDILVGEEQQDHVLVKILRKVIPGMKSLEEQEEYITKQAEQARRQREEEMNALAQKQAEQAFSAVDSVIIDQPKQASRQEHEKKTDTKNQDTALPTPKTMTEKQVMRKTIVDPDLNIEKEIKKVSRQELENVKKINKLIAEINALLNQKPTGAARLRIKKLYQDLLALYESLQEETKAEHYLLISEIYRKLADNGKEKPYSGNRKDAEKKPEKKKEPENIQVKKGPAKKK